MEDLKGMGPVLDSFFAGFPVLIVQFAVTLGMLGLGAVAYHLVTPHHEIALIKRGNTAAAVSLGGALVGLAVPLAACLATSVGTIDIVVWGVVTLMLQLFAYRIADLVLRDLAKRIENDEIGPAVLLVAIKLAVAAINAAAIGG
jgi:putative membrane protein